MQTHLAHVFAPTFLNIIRLTNELVPGKPLVQGPKADHAQGHSANGQLSAQGNAAPNGVTGSLKGDGFEYHEKHLSRCIQEKQKRTPKSGSVVAVNLGWGSCV
jgi:hypothetical protein